MLSGPRGPLRKLKGNFHEIPGRVLKTLILTFSPREKEPPLRAITETRDVSLLAHSLPLGETHAQAAVMAVFQ